MSDEMPECGVLGLQTLIKEKDEKIKSLELDLRVSKERIAQLQKNLDTIHNKSKDFPEYLEWLSFIKKETDGKFVTNDMALLKHIYNCSKLIYHRLNVGSF